MAIKFRTYLVQGRRVNSFTRSFHSVPGGNIFAGHTGELRENKISDATYCNCLVNPMNLILKRRRNKRTRDNYVPYYRKFIDITFGHIHAVLRITFHIIYTNYSITKKMLQFTATWRSLDDCWQSLRSLAIM